jgi:UDP-2,3-diacylglucosamine pyrophosphatase LpxH
VCEKDPPEKTPLKEVSSDGREIIVVSDLHMGEGQTGSGTYQGTENFFWDASFRRFLLSVQSRGEARPTKGPMLIINGDFIDFLRVISYPESDSDFLDWSLLLDRLGFIAKTADVLRASVKDKEKELGLKTHDYKSVWKLERVVEGHPLVFDGLASWINRGDSVLILKGNHDLEWYWPAVRNHLRLVLADRIQALNPSTSLRDCLTKVISLLTFIDDACTIDKEVYVEHGHRYDKFTKVLDSPTWGEHGEELNIPFGSFVNRYLLNNLELIFPFMDNVRPQADILHLLMRERFFLGVKVLFYCIPFTIKMIPKRYGSYMLKPVLGYALAIGLPLLLALALWGGRLYALLSPGGAGATNESLGGVVLQQATGFLKEGALLLLSYLFSRFVSWVQLSEPDDLLEPGKKILGAHPEYRLVTMGHTHNPQEYEKGGRWFFNTGTWIPVVESSSAAIREDKTFTLLLLGRSDKGTFAVQPLQRWNDDAGRIEPLMIVDRK